MSKPRHHTDPSFPPYFLKRSFRCTVEEALDRATLVSFDVFDTLLRRPFLEPSHLFDALGSTRAARDFGNRRRWAEEAARHRHAPQRDVTLEQIYDILHDEPRQELAFEEAHIYPRVEITKWLSLARAKGKKVVAVSDMYLPQAFIAQLLQMHRLPVDDLIVSSHDGVAKFDGSSYRLLQRRHGVAFKDILHFGDNRHADYEVPASLNIPAVLVANKVPRGAEDHHLARLLSNLETNGSHHGSNIGSILRDALATTGPTTFWPDIGRYIVAPLVTGFAEWIASEARAEECDRIAFVARDGKLPREAFRALYPTSSLATPYVHLSRAVILRAGFETRSEMVLYQLCSGIEAPVSDYVKRLGDGVEPLLLRARRHFGGDPVVHKDVTTDELEAFYLAAKDELSAIASSARPLLYRYLEQHDLLRDPARVAVADVGWGGTTASVLWDTVPESREWTWLYFGTRKEFKPKATKQRAMFFTYGVPWHHHRTVFDCVEIVEFLFSAPEPSTVGLRETSTGVEPQFAPEDAQWSGWAPRVNEMAAGFRDMLPEFARRARSPYGLHLDQPTIATLLGHLIYSHDATVVREFGQLQHQLGFGASRFEPILPETPMPYWKNIWRLLKGRSLKLPSGRLYWPYQLPRLFLLQQKGMRLALAQWATRWHKRGGLFRRRRRK
jgi:FMN phosphatase YigB (HAD superfamily)